MFERKSQTRGRQAAAALTLAGLLLSGCLGSGLDTARQMKPGEDPFQLALYDGYLALAEAEYSEGDYADAEHFARRASEAAEGFAVEPQALEDRNLPEPHRLEAEEARADLMLLLKSQPRGVAAIDSAKEVAHAQVAFDCWLQELEENRQPEDIEACRVDFYGALLHLEAVLADSEAQGNPVGQAKYLAQVIANR